MKNKITIKWLPQPEDQDYPAAAAYLSLIYDKKTVNHHVAKLRKALVSSFKSKDVFRASGLSLMGVSNSHVEKDRQKLMAGKQLSPLLLVRDPHLGKVVIADGYHRLCAVYTFNEDEVVACKIV